MYPSLYYFFKDIFGLELGFLKVAQTFGFFLALAIMSGAYIVYLEFKRLRDEGRVEGIPEKVMEGEQPSILEVAINAFFGGIIGWKVVYMLTNTAAQNAPHEALLSWDGSIPGLIVGALFFGGLQFYQKWKAALPQPREIEKTVYPHHRVGDIMIIGAIFGILGSKLFTFVEDWSGFMADPIGHLFSFSGLTFYGAPFGAVIPLYIYMKRKKIPFIRFLDTVAFGLIIGYAVGRLGCHFSGDGDWGMINEAAKPAWFILPDWAWAYDYPNNVSNVGQLIPGCEGQYCKRLVPPVYPTPIWETTFGLIILGILWAIRKRITHIPGLLFSIYLVLNGIERFFIEFIRVNDRYSVLGMELSQAQIIALGIMVLGLVLGLFFYQRKNKEPDDDNDQSLTHDIEVAT